MIIAVGVENQPSVELCVTAIKIVFVFVLCVEMWCNISHQLHKYQQRYYCAVTWWLREQRKILYCDYYLWSMFSFTFYNSISALRSFTGEMIRTVQTFGMKYCSVVVIQNYEYVLYNQIIAYTGKALMTVRFTYMYITTLPTLFIIREYVIWATMLCAYGLVILEQDLITSKLYKK